MLHTFFFSPSNTTRKYAEVMTDAFGGQSGLIDLTHKTDKTNYDLKDGDTVLFLSPVYAGRIPEIVAKQFREIDGHGKKAIVAVVYGNRDYDDALLELADIASTNGFEVIAAGAFIAQHCIFPKVATGRPDKSDIEIAVDFIKKAKDSELLDISSIKGNRPYKKPGNVPLRPQTDEKSCRSCGVCVRECPTGAIDPMSLSTDKDVCITCCRCIAVCDSNARKFKGIMYSTVGKIFCAQNSGHREAEFFL